LVDFFGSFPAQSSDQYLKDRYWADLATDIPQVLRERKLGRYHRGVFECVWDRTDPLPAPVLWTLFPVIALENSLPARLSEGGVNSQVQHAS
jgi:hypothetical protein